MHPPLPITLADIESAAQQLQGIANLTPIMTSRTLNQLVGCAVFLKCESFQRAGAFKFRGAYNAISRLAAEQQRRGVVTFSSGNHAQGVALAAQLLGVPAIICMPDDAPHVKLAATRGYGAAVRIFNRRTTDREAFARSIAAEHSMTLIPPFDHPHIMAGQGTAARELLHAIPDLDTIMTPVGGGGLLAGCAVAAKETNPAIHVFGVETEGADDARQSLERGEIVTIPPPSTIADGIRTPALGVLTFAVIKRYVEQIFVVSDQAVLDAMQFMFIRMKLVVEPTGAVALAALMRGLVPAECKRVGVVVSGGNVDP